MLYELLVQFWAGVGEKCAVDRTTGWRCTSATGRSAKCIWLSYQSPPSGFISRAVYDPDCRQSFQRAHDLPVPACRISFNSRNTASADVIRVACTQDTGSGGSETWRFNLQSRPYHLQNQVVAGRLTSPLQWSLRCRQVRGQLSWVFFRFPDAAWEPLGSRIHLWSAWMKSRILCTRRGGIRTAYRVVVEAWTPARSVGMFWVLA